MLNIENMGMILTIISYAIYFISRFMKTKNKILIFDVTSKVVTIFALYFLGSLSGSLSTFVGLISICFIVFLENNIETKESKIEKKNSLKKSTTNIIFSMFFVVYIVIGIFTYISISTVLVAITNLIVLIGNWYGNPQQIRKAGMIASVVYTLFQFSINNYVGVILEILVLISNILSYVKNR